VQEVELWLIVAAALAIAVVWTIRARAHLAEHPLAIGAMLGVVPGLIGAVIVLVPRTDLIPDGVEPLLWILIGLTASGIALVALSVGFARR
jgi:hypothetical protein